MNPSVRDKIQSWLNSMGDWNPQFLRELQSRFNARNLAFVTGLGLLGQMAFMAFFWQFLPATTLEGLQSFSRFNRYCIGSPPPSLYPHNPSYAEEIHNYCVTDFLGKTVIDYSLWWLDSFITLSMVGVVILLVVGCFLLISDLHKEESRGTLNFIRLSPQPAQTIFIGKILGVPSLLYWLAGMTIPLHLGLGLMAGIPLMLILGFYGVLIAGCAFFYHLAILLGLTAPKLSKFSLAGFQSFGGSGILLFFLFVTSIIILNNNEANFHGLWDWLLLLHPGQSLTYLVQSTFFSSERVGYFHPSVLTTLRWYGQPLFTVAGLGMLFMMGNYAIGTYLISRGINRRFHSPNSLLMTKPQSYQMTLIFVVMALGFLPQSFNRLTRYQETALYANFVLLQVALFGLMTLLAIALSPDRSKLYLWSRYRHLQPAAKRALIRDYLWGENSPAQGAIAVNLAIALLYLTPSIFLFNLGNYRLTVLVGLILGAGIILLYATLYQRCLLFAYKHRRWLGLGSVGLLFLFPFVTMAMAQTRTGATPSLFLISFLPMLQQPVNLSLAFLTILGQGFGIVLLSVEMHRHLMKLGQSETQKLSEKFHQKAINSHR